MKKYSLMAMCGFLFFSNLSAQQSIPIPLSNLSAFHPVDGSWEIASDVDMSLNQTKLSLKKGEGVVVNLPRKGGNNLVLNEVIKGDTEIDFDFMTSKGGNAAVYVAGRYKILLSDSWSSQEVFRNAGLVQLNAKDRHSAFHAQQPYSDVVKAPGLWQHLKVKYRAPKMDANDQKVHPAVFEEIYLNGVLIHQDLLLEEPSEGALFSDESTQGPLMFQGDDAHGLALKNISYQALPEIVDADTRRRWPPSNPILVYPDKVPYLLRSYLLFEGHKRTHVISVGNPDHTNYSYDLKQGSILQFWRGGFVDATQMWESRGEPQLARPLGAVISLSSSPTLAVLNQSDEAWPDSIPFEDLDHKGYALAQDQSVSFMYDYAGVEVTDKIVEADDGRALKREVRIEGNPENLYFRIAHGKEIESLGKGLYAIDHKAYYIQMDDPLKPTLRNSEGGQELIVPLGKNNSSVNYSIIW